MNRRVIAIVEVVIGFKMFFCMPANVADAFYRCIPDLNRLLFFHIALIKK